MPYGIKTTIDPSWVYDAELFQCEVLLPDFYKAEWIIASKQTNNKTTTKPPEHECKQDHSRMGFWFVKVDVSNARMCTHPLVIG